jgi:hypothetical protein
VQYKLHTFEPTPLDLLYDRDSEVLVMFQNGPGIFSFSPEFCAQYLERFRAPVNYHHRVDNINALQLYSELGPWLSNGPVANIQLAAVPKKAQGATRVLQVHPDGTEVVFVDTNQYAQLREDSRQGDSTSQFLHHPVNPPFPFRNAYQNEAYTLDGWVRLVRLRPMLPCGL